MNIKIVLLFDQIDDRPLNEHYVSIIEVHDFF